MAYCAAKVTVMTGLVKLTKSVFRRRLSSVNAWPVMVAKQTFAKTSMSVHQSMIATLIQHALTRTVVTVRVRHDETVTSMTFKVTSLSNVTMITRGAKLKPGKP